MCDSESTRLMFLVLALSGCTQDERINRISLDNVCTQCAITADVVWHSGENEDIEPSHIVLEHNGGVMVVGDNSGFRLIRLDQAGATVRTGGRRGQGPGEFLAISHVELRHDTLVVFDGNRVTWLDTMFATLRTIQLPIEPIDRQIVMRADGSIVAGAARRMEDGTIARQHLMAANGDIQTSYAFAAQRDPVGKDVLRHGGGDTIIALITDPHHGYTLEWWQPSQGQMLRSLTRRPRWWEPWNGEQDTDEGGGRTVRPPSAALDVFSGDEGLIWVVGRISDPRWPGRPSGSEYHLRYDGVIEVLDGESGQPLAGMILDDIVIGFTNTGAIYSYSEDIWGRPRITIHRITMRALDEISENVGSR